MPEPVKTRDANEQLETLRVVEPTSVHAKIAVKRKTEIEGEWVNQGEAGKFQERTVNGSRTSKWETSRDSKTRNSKNRNIGSSSYNRENRGLAVDKQLLGFSSGFGISSVPSRGACMLRCCDIPCGTRAHAVC